MSEWETIGRVASKAAQDMTDSWETVVFMESPEEKRQREYQERYAKIQQQNIDEMNFGEKMLVSTGREFSKFGAGIADLYDIARFKLGGEETKASAIESMQARQKEQADLDELYKPLADDSPTASIVGAALPYLATLPVGIVSGAVGKAVPSIAARGATQAASHIAKKEGARQTAKTLAKLVGKEAAIGAVTGAAHYDDTALSGAAWGAGGAVAGKYLGDLLGGTAENLKGEAKKIVKFAKKNGLYVPPGMATGNPKLQMMDNALATHPNTASEIQKRLDLSKQKENRLISKELGGEPADYFTTDYLADQRSRIKSELDRLAKGTTGKLSDEHAYKVTQIIDDFKDTDPGQASRKILDNFENRIYNLADSGKELTGDQFQTFTSQLNKAATKQYSSMAGDKDLGKALSEISNVFNDAIETGLGSSKSAAWKKARKQYALLNAIEDAKDHTGVKGMPGVIGYIDTTKLAKKFKGSDIINKLAEVEKLRKADFKSSLSTSSLLGRILSDSVVHPNEALGAASLLGSRIPQGVVGLDKLFTNIYLAGYPHASGIVPGAKYVKGGIEDFVARMAMQGEDDSGAAINRLEQISMSR